MSGRPPQPEKAGAGYEKQYEYRKAPGTNRSPELFYIFFFFFFKENYCLFLILEVGIFFMAAESRAWGSWAP